VALCAGGDSSIGFSGATGVADSAGAAADTEVAALVPAAGVGRVRRVGRGGIVGILSAALAGRTEIFSVGVSPFGVSP